MEFALAVVPPLIALCVGIALLAGASTRLGVLIGGGMVVLAVVQATLVLEALAGECFVSGISCAVEKPIAVISATCATLVIGTILAGAVRGTRGNDADRLPPRT